MRGGWVVVLWDGPERVRWEFAATARDVLELTAGCERIGVDVPLGLDDDGYRACDLAAREYLGEARSSIFHAPVRAVLGAGDYAEACAISQRITGRKISKQTWFITDGIQQWDALPDDPRVVEVHPECSFRAMGVTASKKTATGVVQRIGALEGFVDPVLPPDLPRAAAIDDVLDALAAAWSALRLAEGGALSLGPGPRPTIWV
jgi:predicted RNase H-like nuclease